MPIVFLHPWTTNGNIWYYQVFPFALTNQVIVVDHRGHGRSDKPKSGYSIQEHARDVAAVLDAAKIDRAVLVGNSIGGMIAMQFTLDHPERVLAAAQSLAAVNRLFAADPSALKIIAGLAEGFTAKEICRLYGMSECEYDTTRKRMRRALLRCGLEWSGS